MKKKYMIFIMMLMFKTELYAATYQYDDLNRVVKITYDSGAAIAYEYDSAGNITKVTNYNPKDNDEEDNSTDDNGGQGDGNHEDNNGGGEENPDIDNGVGGGKPDSGSSGQGGKPDSGSSGQGGKPDSSDDGQAGEGLDGSNDEAEAEVSQDENDDIDENKITKELVLTLNSKVGYLNGEEISLTGSMFISKQNRLMLPIRQISYAINVPNNKILWDEKNKIVTIYGERKIIVQVNSPYMIVDDKNVELNERAQIKEGRVYLPIADICRAFELRYHWDNIKKEITIY